VFNRGVRRTATIASLALLAAVSGCGGGGSKQQASAPAQSAPAVTTTSTVAQTTSTARKRKSHSSGTATVTTGSALKVASRYTCKGKPLRGLSASGPVKVQPAVVKPGQAFTVTVTDRSAKVADVSLTGVASVPIVAHGVAADDGLVARLRMPTGASCGNKLLEIEGDVSAQAYVGVSG
jgi:hypothetical protein